MQKEGRGAAGTESGSQRVGRTGVMYVSKADTRELKKVEMAENTKLRERSDETNGAQRGREVILSSVQSLPSLLKMFCLLKRLPLKTLHVMCNY